MTISKADKLNSIFVICQNAYHEKVLDFIHKNNLANIVGNLTKKFQKEVRNKKYLQCL